MSPAEIGEKAFVARRKTKNIQKQPKRDSTAREFATWSMNCRVNGYLQVLQKIIEVMTQQPATTLRLAIVRKNLKMNEGMLLTVN